jgi:hypothetical protein
MAHFKTSILRRRMKIPTTALAIFLRRLMLSASAHEIKQFDGAKTGRTRVGTKFWFDNEGGISKTGCGKYEKPSVAMRRTAFCTDGK